MIIFDLDGTLINSEYFLKKTEAELKCEMGIPTTIEEQILKFGGIGPHQQLEIDPNLPDDFARVAELRFRERAATELKACEGVKEFLSSCNQQKIIASNGPLEWIETALKVTGLDYFFSKTDLFHVGLVKNKKPAPDLFLHAAKANKAKTDEIIVIEDSITGVKAGLSARFKTLGYTGTSVTPKKTQEEMTKLGVTATFYHYSELPALL